MGTKSERKQNRRKNEAYSSFYSVLSFFAPWFTLS